MLIDNETTLGELKQLAKQFRDARDWEQFHDVKNLASAISIEAGELEEKFLWKTVNEISSKLQSDPQYHEAVTDEFADIIIFCLHFSNASGIDISEAVQRKIEKTEQKYPVEKAKGNAKKYTEI